MKRILAILLAAAMLLLTACGGGESAAEPTPTPETYDDATRITLSDSGVTAEGSNAAAVYTDHDIVYYEAGQDFTYGEGSAADEHTVEEAAAHTVVHITAPGDYYVTGKLSAGQIAVDLGEDAESDPNAVVTLIFGGADITCTVAPGIIFYNVYECSDKDPETAEADVDTSAAGANVVLAAGTKNTVNGSYVARIYKSVELNEEGTEVVASKKLHKYDGAFYSKQSMNISGAGELHIRAENEGLDSECHLTINGGDIYIRSGNDGINTNEDEVSVTTINGGLLDITVTGETGEGDGIDSNGWLVINGGRVIARACGTSMDSGIDADMGIHLNGGDVIATGNMLDRMDGDYKTFPVNVAANTEVTFKTEDGEEAERFTGENAYSILLLAGEAYSDVTAVYSGETLLAEAGSGMGGFGGMGRPGGMEPPEGFDPDNMPEGFDPNNRPQGFGSGQRPEGFEGMEPPEGFEGRTPPEGMEFPGEPPERK